jgi:phenylpyruvate tautomerase PptA (4-oxalocrotonate tautomerase family)
LIDTPEAVMPIYTCTANDSTFTAHTKRALAAEVAAIHAEINHVPSTYVKVVFHELPTDNVYTDGQPAAPVLMNGWVRQGHPAQETTQLATEVASAITRITGVEAERVLVVIQNSPAYGAVEGGYVLPEPGQETDWIARDLSARDNR